MIRDRILECLEDSPKTNKELRRLLPDLEFKTISAVVSLYRGAFLRLDRGIVGLVGRDEHLVKPRARNKLCLFKKIFNVLRYGHIAVCDLYLAIPDEKQVSIRATISMNQHVFLRLTKGVVGLRNRDEHLIEKFERKKLPLIPVEKRPSIRDKLERILSDGKPRSLSQIHHLIPQYPRKSITAKLTLDERFVRVGNGYWKRNT